MASESDIARAVTLLREGGLVALPTETVYGLAARADDELAVRRIFAVKGRPESHPLIVHLASADALDGWAARVPPTARRLAETFWPGPLTLVLPRSSRALDVITAGQATVALRVPSHPDTQAVLAALGTGVAAPSANRFGHVSPTTAQHVLDDLGDDVDFVLDGGPCPIGVESTIVDCSGEQPTLLRPGGVGAEEIERVLQSPLASAGQASPRAPGTLAAHYAPRAGVELCAPSCVEERAAALKAEGRRVGLLVLSGAPIPSNVVALATPKDATEFARVLYGALRWADELGCDVVLVCPPEAAGLGLAVRDRLARAARGRP